MLNCPGLLHCPGLQAGERDEIIDTAGISPDRNEKPAMCGLFAWGRLAMDSRIPMPGYALQIMLKNKFAGTKSGSVLIPYMILLNNNNQFINAQKNQNMKKSFFSLATAVIVSGVLLVACNNESNSSMPADNNMNASKDSNNMKMDDKKMNAEEEGVMVGGSKMVKSKNIVENALGSADHTTLVAAVKAAGLVETLSGKGPFTVFAPTNAAFDKLPKGTVDGLLKPEKKADLTKVLTYHVVPGALKAADLKDGQKLKTVQGEELTVSVKDGKVMINGATVTIADVISSNGVTHVIDGVLLPK